MKRESTDDKPWVSIHDKHGDPEGHIMGNEKGLKELRDRIDEALESGVGLCRNLDCDFNSVKLMEEDPRVTSEPMTIKGKAMSYGFLAIIAICLLIFGFGLLKLCEALNQ
ncbi:hypothetical protein [Cerasicoccus arenae]|uniref:Uncharacterized protein n=1 Tax=Cerasicoccus arenae TaxID=424488 RepID=A0A8J3D7F6_9BACT|nr:hypothetical protein [Cerasicoccus arenae]MBK1857137.1 hypothetical protein [Cerasicoccus arenae]GHB92582.1 hypothetical protein GCM10007047_04690 [Cerasicoccus arenae]